MFRRNLELTARKFACIGGKGLGVTQCKIGANAASHPGLLDFRQGGNLAQQLHMNCPPSIYCTKHHWICSFTARLKKTSC